MQVHMCVHVEQVCVHAFRCMCVCVCLQVHVYMRASRYTWCMCRQIHTCVCTCTHSISTEVKGKPSVWYCCLGVIHLDF